MVVQSTTNLIVVLNAGREVEWVNPAFEKLTGWLLSEVKGRNIREIFYGALTDTTVLILVDSLLSTGESVRNFELRQYKKSGEAFWVSANIEPVFDEAGSIKNFVAVYTDITAHKASEDEIVRLALHDALTGLPNRVALNRKLREVIEVARYTHTPAALYVIDIDNFKQLNDIYGHAQGDRLLVMIADTLRSLSKNHKLFLSRYGGDEFVVIAKNLECQPHELISQVDELGELIRLALNLSVMEGDLLFFCTPSIGATVVDGSEPTAGVLLQQGDLAMYEAKSKGKNSVCIFEGRIQNEFSRRTKIEIDLRQALQKQEFMLAFQPIVSLERQVCGFEALLRWNRHGKELVNPVDFIPVAESCGLIISIGEWVLRQACATLREWEEQGRYPGYGLSINISATQLMHPSFVEMAFSIFLETQAPTSRLKLEVTESLMMHDLEAVRSKILALRQAGCRFSLDDFGTGYSSLGLLRHLPFDEIKIDRSFVHELLGAGQARPITRTIIQLAEDLNMSVVAEGVEFEEQFRALLGMNCRLFQGYLFGRPLPLPA
ncbi:MAG: EAL domain-containing protein [Curvibacter sp.]|nr:EAL domain-containing protein [Curvibacter sp.]